MDLHHEFEVAAKVDEVWPAFVDMPRLAPCMPGAEITEIVDDHNVKGAAKVKVGPVNLRFAGTGEMTDVDNDARSARLKATGSDAKGRGNADADIRFQLTEQGPERTAVDVSTSLRLTGSVAQYGRASGLIDEIANQLLAEFVKNLEAELASGTEPEAALEAASDSPASDDPASVDAPLGDTALDNTALENTALDHTALDHTGADHGAPAGAGEPRATASTGSAMSRQTGPRSATSLSGLKIFFRALVAMIRKRLGSS